MELRDLQHQIAEHLDKVVVRYDTAADVLIDLAALRIQWRIEQGGEAGEETLLRTEQCVRAVQAYAAGDLSEAGAINRLLNLKLDLRIAAAPR